MPYIKDKDVKNLLKTTTSIPVNVGELNFKITTIIDEYLLKHGLSYNIINEAMGALECAKLELYRRVAAPYEDVKIKENGDVYSKENLI